MRIVSSIQNFFGDLRRKHQEKIGFEAGLEIWKKLYSETERSNFWYNGRDYLVRVKEEQIKIPYDLMEEITMEVIKNGDQIDFGGIFTVLNERDRDRTYEFWQSRDGWNNYYFQLEFQKEPIEIPYSIMRAIASTVVKIESNQHNSN
jgi:hypothetical protein